VAATRRARRGSSAQSEHHGHAEARLVGDDAGNLLGTIAGVREAEAAQRHRQHQLCLEQRKVLACSAAAWQRPPRSSGRHDGGKRMSEPTMGAARAHRQRLTGLVEVEADCNNQ
jgi:hypothetical protein